MVEREEMEAMAAAMQKSVEQTLETNSGECIAYDEDSGKEYSHKWRSGEARIFVEDDDRCVDYVFRVRVELVAVLDS